MAGHSKWANIKHRKAAQDARRGKLFTRLIREITIAARSGGEPADNPRLRLAMDKALAANMTRDTIERAVKRGAGGDGEAALDELTYEGYGPAGVAVFVEAMTDNRNRTAAAVRHAFSKAGGNLGTDGSVAFLFERRGEIILDAEQDEDSLMLAALEAGAEDVAFEADRGWVVVTPWEQLAEVSAALQMSGYASNDAEIVRVATTEAPVSDADTAQTVLKLLDALEELDDVQNVFSNVAIDPDVLADLS